MINADHLDREIILALQRGVAVITDRHYHSSLAYQSLARSTGRGQPQRALSRPDITIFLDLELEISLARIEARGETKERSRPSTSSGWIQEAYYAVLVYCRAQ